MRGTIFCLLPPLCLVNSAKANYFEKILFFPANCIREVKWGVNLGYRKLLARLAQKVESIYVSHSHPLFHHHDMGDNTSEAKSKKPRVVRDIRGNPPVFPLCILHIWKPLCLSPMVREEEKKGWRKRKEMHPWPRFPRGKRQERY